MKTQIINILMKHSLKGLNHASLSSQSFDIVANDIVELIHQPSIDVKKTEPENKQVRKNTNR